MRPFLLALALIGSHTVIQAQMTRPVPEAALDVYSPVALDQLRFAGLFSSRVRANREGYLEHIDFAALNGAAENPDPELAEAPGLFLVAASNSYEASDDVQLKAVMDRVAAALLKAQSKDGYIGFNSPDKRWSTDDVLTQAASLIGLLAYSRVTGDDDAGLAAKRAIDAAMVHFRPAGKGKGSALLPAISELYRASGDPRYLNFAKQIADASAPDSTPLVSVLRAYGLVELYRLTGEEGQLHEAEHTWAAVHDASSSALGVPAPGERINGCVTLAWFQLTLDLLRITGQAEYAASLENVVYNVLLPAQDAGGGNIDSDIRLGAAKQFSRQNSVCAAAVSVAISELASITWGRFGFGLAVLSYNPGRAFIHLRRRASVQLYSEGDYPASGTVLLHVEPSHDVKFPLRLYVPAWTSKFQASIGDTHVSGQPGHFLVMDREWKRGDTVRIQIDMTAAVVRDSRDSSHVALRRGPELLTLVSQDKYSGSDTALSQAIGGLKPAGAMGMPDGAQEFEITVGGKQLTLTPFADSRNASVWFASGS